MDLTLLIRVLSKTADGLKSTHSPDAVVMGSGCRRDQRRVYCPRTLLALLESITAHRRANTWRISSEIRR